MKTDSYSFTSVATSHLSGSARWKTSAKRPLQIARAAAAACLLAAGATHAGLIVSNHATGLAPNGDFVLGAGESAVLDFDLTGYVPVSSFGFFLRYEALSAGERFQLFLWGDQGGTGTGPSFWGPQTGPAGSGVYGYGVVAGTGAYNMALADGLFSLELKNLSSSGDISFSVYDITVTMPNGQVVDLFDQAANSVPEPGSLALLGIASLGASFAGWRRRA